MNTNRINSHEALDAEAFDTSDRRTAVEAPTTLRRPHPNGDEKIPVGPPPDDVTRLFRAS
jgi:hypothetical protein